MNRVKEEWLEKGLDYISIVKNKRRFPILITMAYVLLENASNIRRIKKETFKRNKEMKQLATYFADKLLYNELRG